MAWGGGAARLPRGRLLPGPLAELRAARASALLFFSCEVPIGVATYFPFFGASGNTRFALVVFSGNKSVILAIILLCIGL